MMEDWIEHRRGRDGELIGWMRPEDEGFVAVDLLGRDQTGIVEWNVAEETLDDLGLAYLADPYEMRLETGEWLRVRLVEVTVRGLRIKKEDWGDMTATSVHFDLPFPVTDRLRPLVR